MLRQSRYYFSIGDCDPYSVKACRDAAKALGKSAGGCGYPFESDFSIKGCYTYRGGIYGKCVFYGTGGTEDEMKRHLFSTAIFRPSGYDCSIDGSVLHIFSWKACIQILGVMFVTIKMIWIAPVYPLSIIIFLRFPILKNWSQINVFHVLRYPTTC